MTFQAVLARQLAALAEQLTAAAAEDIETLSAQVAEATASRDRYRARADELTAVNDSLSLELEARAAEREAAAGAVTELDAERERSTRLAGQLAALESQHADLQRQIRGLEESASVLRESAGRQDAERAASDAALADAANARDRERASREALETEIARVRVETMAARAEFESQITQLKRALDEARLHAEGEASLLREELTIARRSNRERLVARLEQVFDEVGRSLSVEDVLSAAANGLAEDFGRIAVFAAQNGRLEARYQRGFDPASSMAQAELGDGSLLARAAESDELGLLMADGLRDLPFGGMPSVIVTAPIKVRGELLALIYADNHGQTAGMESPETPVRVADIVRRHTALRLDRLTVELKTMGELRAYARMLLDEVEYVYRADVSARKSDTERTERLTENLRCARQIYQQRVAVEGPAMALLIEEVITAAIAAKAGTPFGRELAGAAPQAHPVAVPA